MADDKLNEDSEEEKKDSTGSQSDEDFGLPDLEFEELEELDFNLDEGSVDEEGDSKTEGSEDSGSVEDIDMSSLDDLGHPADASELLPGDLEPPESALDEGIEEVEDVLDSAQLISDRLGDIDVEGEADISSGIDYNELVSAPSESSDAPSVEFDDIPDFSASLEEESGINIPSEDVSDDILGSIDSPDDLAALGMADESEDEQSSPEATGTLKPEESSLFSADELDTGGAGDSESSIFASDTMSMETEDVSSFEPQEKPTLPPGYKPYAGDGDSASFSKVIIIGAVVFIAIGFGLMWMYNQSDGENKQVAKTEKTQKAVPKKTTKNTDASSTDKTADDSKKNTKTENSKATTKKATPVSAKKTPKSTKRKPATKKPVVASAQPGEIVRVENGTGRSYVIIGSFIDEDLAMDYAVVLSGQGKGIKIISPFGKTRRFRVSVADYGTFAAAASGIDSFKGEYGNDVWALKY